MPKRAQNLYSKKYKNSFPISDVEDGDDDGNDDKTHRTVYQRRPHNLDKVSRYLLNNTRDTLEHVDHHYIPGFNQSRAPPKELSECRQYPSCKFSVPVAVHVSDVQSTLREICMRRPKAYENWHRQLIHLKSRYEKNKKKISGNSDKSNIYQATVYDFAKHLAMNPDPFFFGTNDYYYTGGNLAVLPLASALMVTPLVLHTTGNNLHEFSISKFLAEKCFAQVHRSKCTAPSEVFEVQSLNCYRVNRGNVFALRQRDCISLHQIELGEPLDDSDAGSIGGAGSAVKKLDSGKKAPPKRTIHGHNDNDIELGEIRVQILTEFKSESTPFISFAQPKSEATKLLISNMKQAVRIYDLGRDTPKMSCMYRLSQDDRSSWNTLRAWQGETIFYANNSYLFPMDLRTNPDAWMKGIVNAESSMFKSCDMISSLSLSNASFQRLYIATAHKLHCLDVRYMTGYLEGKGSIATWTHQLEYGPSLMDTFATDDGNEFVAVSSLLPGDLHICELSPAQHLQSTQNAPNERHYTTYTIPYQPPTIEEAYQSAREANKFLYPLTNIQQRLGHCTTGLAFYDMDKWSGVRNANDDVCAYLMTSNSVGDVLAQGLTPRTDQENEERISRHTDKIFDKYITLISEQIETPLNYTKLHDLKCLRKVLRCEQLSVASADTKLNSQDDSAEVTAQRLDVKRVKRNHRWRKSYKTLSSFKDYLVDDLLSVWDIPNEETKHGIPVNIDKQLIADAKPKMEDINDWLSTQALQVMTTTETDRTEVIPKKEISTLENHTASKDVWPADLMVSIPGHNFSQTELAANYDLNFSEDIGFEAISSTQVKHEADEYGSFNQTITISDSQSRKRKRPAARKGF